MTGEPDGKSDRRPPTIELQAKEVTDAAPAPDTTTPETKDSEPPAGGSGAADRASSDRQPTDSSAKTQAPPRAGRLGSGHVASGAIGAAFMAAIVGAIAAGLWFVGLVPMPETGAANAPGPSATVPIAPATNDNDKLAARLDQIERSVQQQRPDPALGARLASAEAALKSLADSVAALKRRIDEVAAASQDAAKRADAAAATATEAAQTAKSSAQSGITHSDLDALSNRIAALESVAKTLAEAQTRQAATTDDRAARLTVAAEALRQAVESGTSFQTELKAVQALGAEASATAPLEAFAADGVPSAAALARQLAALLPELARNAASASGGTTFLQRLEANAQKLVSITPVDAPPGNDRSSVTGRIANDAARADIGAAQRDLADLPDDAKPLVADWIKKTAAREAALAASRQLAHDALANLSKAATP